MKTVRVHTQLSADNNNRLNAIAKSNGVDKWFIINNAVTFYLSKHKPTKKVTPKKKGK